MRAARRGLGLLVLLLLAPAARAQEPEDDLVAVRIDEANAAERLIGGPDAIGGVGDWYLANDVVEFVIDDPSRRHAKLNHGGTVVDAGLRGRPGDDQLARLFPLVNLDQRVQLGIDTARAEVDPEQGFARVVVSGSRGLSAIARGGALLRRINPLVPETAEIAEVFVETRYELRRGEPFLRMVTTLDNRGSRPAPVFAYGEVWMRGGRSMRSFVGDTLTPERSRGFHHRDFDAAAILESSAAMAGYTFVAMAGLPDWPPVAYALAAPERAREGRRLFGVTGKHVTLANAFLRDPGWEELGLLRLLGATRDALEPGESFRHERWLLVTPGPDVASATDRLFPLLGVTDGRSGLRGRVAPAGARAAVHVADAAGAPITQVSSARSGEFQAVLPPGEYTLTLRALHRAPRELRARVSEGVFTELPVLELPPLGELAFGPAAFADGGAGRVVVTGLDGTPDPVFRPELLDFRIDGSPSPSGTETREIHFVGGEHDPRRVALAPGRYRLTATRGPEFEIATRELSVEAGAATPVPPFALARAVVLPGTTSGDFHVHAQASDDSGMSNQARLRSYVAEHVDVMISTDHDHLADFGPALRELGLEDRITVVTGVEVTSSAPSPAAPWTLGHHNAWPVAHRAHQHRKGAPPNQDMRVGELYSLLRRQYGARVVQQNHPLAPEPGRSEGAFWTHLGHVGEGFDPGLPLDAEPNRALLEAAPDGTRGLDFDAVEVMNGRSFDQYRRVRAAWYALLRAGYRRTATGNSDTHGPDEVAGYPRNYVALAPPFEAVAFDAAIREGRLFATTGPLVATFRANGGGVGDVVAAPGGAVEVEIAVAAASWVPVDEVRLLLDGEVVRRWRDLAPAGETVRLRRREKLVLARDGFLTLEAGAPLDADPERWGRERGGAYARDVAPGFVSQALTNPIFIDVDGDGAIAPAPVAGTGGLDRLVVMLAVLALLALLWWRMRVRVGLRPPP